jgi:tetratricopeptide (TPR) repeat protein
LNGRVLVGPLVLALAFALAAQTMRWQDRSIVSRTLRTVEALTMPAFNAGRTDVLQTNLEVLRQAQKREPLEVGLPTARGTQHYLLKQPQAAIDAYEESLRLEPRPETYVYLGLALHQAGRTEEAIRAFRTGLRIDPRLQVQVPPSLRESLGTQ